MQCLPQLLPTILEALHHRPVPGADVARVLAFRHTVSCMRFLMARLGPQLWGLCEDLSPEVLVDVLSAPLQVGTEVEGKS